MLCCLALPFASLTDQSQNRPTRTAYVQIFKKDDKTYEADELAATARWSYYVSTFSMLDHTEGVPLSSIRLPYLRRNMPFPPPSKDTSSEEVADMTGFAVPMYNEDGLVLRISPNNYHILYDPYTSDWWIQSAAFRKRGLGAYEEVKQERKRGLQALFDNRERNEWMKGLQDMEIEKTRATFESWIKDGPAVLEGDAATALENRTADAIMGGTS